VREILKADSQSETSAHHGSFPPHQEEGGMGEDYGALLISQPRGQESRRES
jgi:hypothetical protein